MNEKKQHAGLRTWTEARELATSIARPPLFSCSAGKLALPISLMHIERRNSTGALGSCPKHELTGLPTIRRSASAFIVEDRGHAPTPAHDQEKLRTVLLLAQMRDEIAKQRTELAALLKSADGTQTGLSEFSSSADRLSQNEQLLQERSKLQYKIARSSSRIDQAEECYLKFQQLFQNIESDPVTPPSSFRRRRINSPHGSNSSLPVQQLAASCNKAGVTTDLFASQAPLTLRAPSLLKQAQSTPATCPSQNVSFRRCISGGMRYLLSKAYPKYSRKEDIQQGNTKRSDSLFGAYTSTGPEQVPPFSRSSSST
eukprot:2741233-Pleurochrysis_carterae.AAC.4